jgi:hypothetical protein
VNTVTIEKPAAKRPKHAVIRLLETWSRETAYDAHAWPKVRRALAKNRLSRRARLDD